MEENWSALVAGKSGIGPITRFDASHMATKIAGEVKDFKPENYVSRKDINRMDIFTQYAMAASRMAVEHSKLKINGNNANKVGVVMGTGLGGLNTIERFHRVLLEQGPRKVSPFFIPMLIANMAPGQISIAFGAKGPNLAIETACAAGTHAVGDAFKQIQRGIADVMIAGGVESTVTPLAISGFNAMRALSTRNDEPQKASRPFERDRDGFVMGEGSGVVILEALDHALERGATIHAELIGFGLSGDAFHISAPAPEGEGMARCMQMALDDAGLVPGDIDYINAHGTSTPLNDVVETRALKAVFGEHANKLAISSTKSMTGHMLGGAGGIESVFLALSIHHQIIPPTINLENPDPECDLDYVPNKARETTIRTALSNSFGFGGTNAVIAMKKFVA